MRYSRIAGIRSLVSCVVAAVLVSACEVEPIIAYDMYTVENSTSCPWVSFSESQSYGTDGYYIAQGESSSFYITINHPTRIEADPDAVAASIDLQDSVIEVVPRLMATDSSYTLLSGLDPWVEHKVTGSDEMPNTYFLSLTDDALSFIANRMRSKGCAPYKITREMIENLTDYDVTITTIHNGNRYVLKVAAGKMAGFPEVGMFFECDNYRISWDGNSLEMQSPFMKSFSGYSYRTSDSENGYRVYRLRPIDLDWLAKGAQSEQ